MDDEANFARGEDAIVLSHHDDHETEMVAPRLGSIKTEAPRSDPSSHNSTPKTLTPTDPFFKTRLCTNFSTKGFCGYAQGCTFAHGMEDLRGGSNSSSSWEARTRVCKMYLRSGDCTYGANCSYLHVEKSNTSSGGEICRLPRTTNPCFSWKTGGKCSYGAHCKFIHANVNQQGVSVEPEGGHKTGASEGSSRSKSNYPFKQTVISSRLKKGSEKLNQMKKVEGIYGDWLE